jgi:hypothetical protein
MAFGNYTELKATIAEYVGRDDIDPQIAGFIALVETELNHDADFRLAQMQWEETLILDQDGEASLPPDFLELYQASMGGGANRRVLKLVDRSNPYVYWNFGITGICIVDTGTITVPGAANGSVNLLYYSAIPPLSDTNPTNWVLAEAPALYLYGAIKSYTAFNREPQEHIATIQMYEQAKDSIKAADRGRWHSMRVRIPSPTP